MKRSNRKLRTLVGAAMLSAVAFVLAFVTVCSMNPLRVNAASAEEKVYSFLTNEMGLNPAGACGIMSNMYEESNFVADITGGGGAYGICQWMGPRRSNLVTFCERKGLNYKNLEGQLKFLESELKSTFPSVYNYLLKVPNTRQGAYDAGYHWCYDFEIPGDRHNASVSRGQVARAYLYMSKRYSIKLAADEEKLYNFWNSHYPPTDWECYRNSAIDRIQGNENTFITASCKEKRQ